MLCRLCLQDRDDLLEIFDKDGERLKIRFIVAQHFGFQLNNNDQISDKICSTCWLEIENFHAFYVAVKRAQKRLNIELAKNIDPDPDTDEEYEEENGDDLEDSDDYEEEENESDESYMNSNENYSGLRWEDTSNLTGDIDVFAAPSRTGAQIFSGSSLAHEKITSYLRNGNNNVIVIDIGSSKCNNNDSKGAFECNENTNGYQDENEFIRNRFKNLGIEGLSKIIDRNELSITACPKMEESEVTKENEKEISKYIQLNCELCGEKFKIFSKLKDHFHNAHNIAGYIICCNEKLFNPAELVTHVMKHLDRSRFTSRSSSVDLPGNLNSKECPICHKKFENSEYSQHLREHFRGKATRVQCQQCGLWCKSRYVLQKHVRSHVVDNDDQMCTICGKKFLSDVALQRHLTNVHYKERKFQCTMCNKAFKWSLNLKEHMAIHTGKRLYSCQYCSRTFNASSNLHSHRKKVHREEWEEDRRKRLEATITD